MVDITTVHNDNITKNRDEIQSMVLMLKDKISTGDLKAQECPVIHRFADGCYMREVLMAAGARVIGKIHATEHFNVLLTGKVTVITAEGSEYIEAPYTFISKAGVQKVVIIHEDCVWQTLHVTDKTNIEEIEKEIIVESYDQLLIDGLLSNGRGVLR